MILSCFLEDLVKSILIRKTLYLWPLESTSGLLIAICFLSLMVVLSINSGLMDTKELEEQKSVPLWVQQKIGIQNNENIPLSDMASLLVFFTGLSSLAGVIYVIIRQRPIIHKFLIARLQTK